jgi:hypothetical protein
MVKQLRRNLAVLIVAVGMLASLSAARAEVTAVVTVRSVDDLMGGIKFVLAAAGREEQAKQLEGLIGAVTQGQGFNGIDTKRPLGLFIGADANNVDNPPAILFLPITKEEEFLDLLKKGGMDAGKPEMGVYTVETQFGPSIYLKFANKCAYASDSADKLEGKLADPAAFVPATNKQNLLAATSRLDLISKELKAQLLEQIDAMLENEKEKKDDESEEDYQRRLMIMKVLREGMGALMEDGKEFAVGFNVDQKESNLVLNVSISAKDDTKTATRIKDFGPAIGNAPVHFEVSVGKLMNLLLPEEGDEKIQEMKKLFAGSEKAKDKIRLSLQGGEALQLKIEVNAGLLKLASMLTPDDE